MLRHYACRSGGRACRLAKIKHKLFKNIKIKCDMSILKNYWLRASAAVLILMLGIGLLVNAMEKGERKKETVETKTMMTTYHFIGNSTSEILDGSKWTQSNPNNPSCDPLATDLPCELAVDASVSSAEELEQYFDEEFDNDTSEITAAASSRKPQP